MPNAMAVSSKTKIVLTIFVLKNCVLPSKELSFVIKIILTMSHGQAALERGLNINNCALNINISLEGVIVKRLVKYHLLANNLRPRTIQITNSMVTTFKDACLKAFFCIAFKLLSLNIFFAFPFQNREARNIFSKSIGLLLCLCFVGTKFVKNRRGFCSVINHCKSFVPFAEGI